MKLRIPAGILAAALIFSQAAANELKPVFKTSKPLGENRAVLYFDSNNRFNVSLLADFLKECESHPAVTCIGAEGSSSTIESVADGFRGSRDESFIYKGLTDRHLPYMEFYKKNKLVGSITSDGSFNVRVGIYLDYISGKFDAKALDDRLKMAESAENYKKIVPRMNFVLLLAKKGETDAALRELESIDSSKLDDKGKLLFGQTYLRLKSPEKALEVLSTCSDTDCRFYTGLAYYLGGDNAKALEILTQLKGKYSSVNKLNFYLKTIYEANGDKKHADEIDLPDNYNIDSE
ncbi:lipopolysaccharide assembly protein LapB [Seleniivibrio woodruffii]|uniref:tetratricopeptide repeat protein n=1 Tax=Seleniivibrio woodruffii TaxID=1078050 RepID=UPI0026EED6E1|nr:tetratricopeptide repeat protein [Seleniivibrio woodruffii]